MTATIDLFTKMRSMLMAIVPSVEVVKGLGNNVSMPSGPFISMIPVGMRRLSTTSHIYYDPVSAINADRATVGTVTNDQSMAIDIQVDCYGPSSNTWAANISALWRDQYAANLFSAIQAAPLYSDDPRMIPLEDAAKNYQERWVTMLTLQYNPEIVTPMYFFDTMPLVYNPPNSGTL